MISTCPRCQKQVSVPPGVDSAALVRCPLCSGEYALNEALAWTPPALIPVVSPVAVDFAPPPHEIPVEPAERDQIGVHEGSEPVNEAVVAVQRFSATSVPAMRRRRKPKSALKTLIEVVTGGLAGCLVAYYALAFYYGPEFRNVGLPQIDLPGIAWITSARTGDKGGEKPAEKKPGAKKSPQSKPDSTNS
jgi:hypothetical protein